MYDQITVMAPNAATVLREWRSAELAANAAEMKCLLEGMASDTAALLRATARELRQMAWSLMRAEVERAAALTKTSQVFGVPEPYCSLLMQKRTAS